MSTRHPDTWLLRGAYVLLGATLTTAAVRQDPQAKPATAAGQAPAQEERDALAKEEEAFAVAAETVMLKVCTTMCHALDRVERIRRTSRDWTDQVRMMQERGAIATDDQLATIRKYLVRYYGLVAVNTATAPELSAVLGFPPNEAEAIVAFRTEHGKFADVAAILKVPGIDKTKIEEQADALVFR